MNASRIVKQSFVILALAAFLLAGGLPNQARAQTFGQMLENTRTEHTRPPAPRSDPKPTRQPKPREKETSWHWRDYERDEEDDDKDGVIAGLVGVLAAAALSSPFWGPRTIVDDEGFDAGYFPRYPYLHDSDGYLTLNPTEERGPSPWLLRACFEYGEDFDAIDTFGGSFLLDTSTRFGIDTEFNRRHEVLPNGSDTLWNGNSNILVRFAQSERVQMRAGIGWNWLDHNSGSEHGLNFTYGGDFFPADPWIISSEIDLGWLGHAGVIHLRTTAGIQFHRFEAYSGFDHFQIGADNVTGPGFGLRLWY
ncbi:MAG: hypothetical protein VXZ82_13735 [Planctomycetota bacterium]|nr:hypothetical protein [Planctomycetota bacterium]